MLVFSDGKTLPGDYYVINEVFSGINTITFRVPDEWIVHNEDVVFETLDRQEKDEEIDIEESELDKDDERYGNVLDAADQMLEEAESFDDLINDANKQADEINRQAQDRDIDQDIDKDYER